MKLEKSGPTIMFSASIILLAGCRHQSGFDQLVSGMAGAKAIQSQFVIHPQSGKDITVNFLFSKPNRFMVTSDDFTMTTNEVDGYYETMKSKKLYDYLPWIGQAVPGTGKLVSEAAVSGGPMCGLNPRDFGKAFKWIFKGKSGDNETYHKTIETNNGPQEYELVVNGKGFPVKFTAPGYVYETKTFEYVDEQPLEKFPIDPREGDVCVRTQIDQFKLKNGQKLDLSKFKAASDVSNFKFDGETLFAIVDPAEASSAASRAWLNKPGAGFRKILISKGDATSGFFDPKGSEIDKLTTSTPAFVLVGKDGLIQGMWLGFDPGDIATFEKDIQRAIEGKE